MSKAFLWFAVLCVFGLFGCEGRKDQAVPSKPAPVSSKVSAPMTAAPLLSSPLQPALVELGIDAMPIWRQFRSHRPTLVLLSLNPFLEPVPEPLRQEAAALIQNGREDALRQRLKFPDSNPLILPTMATDAALRAGLFSELIWVIPATVSKEKLDLTIFRQQLVSAGIADEKEAGTFTLQAGVFSGQLRGIPVRAVHPEALPSLSGPAVVHLDLSFFSPLYKGEIKTPIYPLVYQIFGRLRQAAWPTAAITISHATLDGALPLTTRFLGDTLAALVDEPALLDRDLPEAWKKRGNALYLPNFFKEDEAVTLYREMETANPRDASIPFALYGLYRDRKEGAKALAALQQAVALDPVYGLEYLALEPVATEQGKTSQALQMLQKAAETFPEDPFIQLQFALALQTAGQNEAAAAHLKKLSARQWSTVYYPDMAGKIDNALSQLIAKPSPSNRIGAEDMPGPGGIRTAGCTIFGE
jgi:hypothetical protein